MTLHKFQCTHYSFKFFLQTLKCDLSLRQLSNLTGISAPTLSRLLNGTIPDLKTLVAISKYTSVSLDTLWKTIEYDQNYGVTDQNNCLINKQKGANK